MDQLHSLAIQAGASFIAILLLWQLSRLLDLGGDQRIRDEDHARELVEEAICGFDPVDLTVDRAGYGAVARDAAGRVLLLRRHGSHFAARLLDSHVGVRLDRQFLVIATADPHFSKVSLDLGPRAQEWAGSFRRLGA